MLTRLLNSKRMRCFGPLLSWKHTSNSYSKLIVSYNYTTRELTVLNSETTEEMVFDENELKEFRSAITALGLNAPEGVQYR